MLERFSYDVWGTRRNATGWVDAGGLTTSTHTVRGYTGHEQLDTVGLVHMNGRVYDPTLGRFTSPDPIIQFADNPQSYNRYSYVLNNPLSFTDPSGFGLFGFLKKIFKAVKKLVVKVLHVVKSLIQHPEQLVALALAATGQVWTYSLFGLQGAQAAFVSGFSAGLVGSKGDLEDALIAGATASAFHQVGNAFEGKTIEVGNAAWAEKSLAHGVVGGLSSTARGGDFVSGFLSAGVAEASTSPIKQMNLQFGGNLIAVSVVGGTVSEIAGGDFANGAVTSAFGYLYNYCAHNHCFNRDFTLDDAKYYWQRGDGAPITAVGSNEVDLAGARFTALKTVPNRFQVDLDFSSSTHHIYGTLSGDLNVDGSISFLQDTYNFDFKPLNTSTAGEAARLMGRNIGTALGRIYNGSGAKYPINFTGSQQLPSDVSNRLRNCSPGSRC